MAELRLNHNESDVTEVKYLPEVLEDRVTINYNNDVIKNMYLLEVFEDKVLSITM